MNPRKEIYIAGYIDGMIGNTESWTEQHVECVLSRVLSIDGIQEWWSVSVPAFNGKTPLEMWYGGMSDRKILIDRVISYLDTSFS